jgi:hypothetical protein
MLLSPARSKNAVMVLFQTLPDCFRPGMPFLSQ